MRRYYHSYVLLLAPLFFLACTPDKSGVAPILPAQKLIVGTWTLQQEHYTQYVDGQVQVDTTMNASANNRAYLQFNSNGTFSSAGLYSSANVGSSSLNLENPGSQPVTAVDSTSGTFAFTGSVLSLSAPVAGLAGGSTLTSMYVSMAPVITPVSHSVSISQLSASSLQIHTEYIYTYTVNSSSQTYKMDDDYAYTR